MLSIHNFFPFPFQRAGTRRKSLCSGQNLSSKPTYLSICANFCFYFCSTCNHLFPLSVVDGIIIPNYFSLSITELLILPIIMGESVCLHLADFGFGPITHFNENVSRYVADHLQAEVLTMLCG